MRKEKYRRRQQDTEIDAWNNNSKILCLLDFILFFLLAMAENESLCNFDKLIDQILESASEAEIVTDECSYFKNYNHSVNLNFVLILLFNFYNTGFKI